MPWSWEGAGRGLATGGVVGGIYGGVKGDKMGPGGMYGDLYNWAKDDVFGITTDFEAQPFEFDESAFQNPYRQEWHDRLGTEIGRARGRETQIATGPQGQFREAQMGLLGQLQQQAAGEGPSLAQQQLQQATNRNLAQALSQQATAGGNPALAQRNMMQQRAAAGQQMAGQSAMARLQEQQQAQQALGQLAGQARGQDIGLATSQANVDLQQQALNDAMVRQFTQMGFDMDQAQFMANQRLQEMQAQQHMGAQGMNLQAALANQQANQQFFGGTVGAAGNVLGMFI